MCLISRNKNGYVADEDIVCYKIVKLVGVSGGIAQFVTPSQNYPVKVNEWLVAEGEIDTSGLKEGEDLVIDDGIIHCYQELYDCILFNGNGSVVLKCIIPAGEVFYLSRTHFGGEVQIGARRVFVTDEVMKMNRERKNEFAKTLQYVNHHPVGESYQLRIPFDYAELEKVG